MAVEGVLFFLFTLIIEVRSGHGPIDNKVLGQDEGGLLVQVERNSGHTYQLQMHWSIIITSVHLRDQAVSNPTQNYK